MAQSKLRVLPLGGLGEIGKNMTVIEYEDRLLVIDTGLRFPSGALGRWVRRATRARSSRG